MKSFPNDSPAVKLLPPFPHYVLSACTSASLEPSYVLRAVGTDEDLAHSSIRFGIGRFTTEEEVDFTIDRCVASVNHLREMR
jgi:cysteine desulfurase